MLNKVTVEARVCCAGIVDDPKYQAQLRRRALAGELPPQIEAMIWYYAKGKRQGVSSVIIEVPWSLFSQGPPDRCSYNQDDREGRHRNARSI